MPSWLRAFLGKNHARLMRKAAWSVGVRPGQTELLDRFVTKHLDALDRHFSRHEFLLGGRPSLGDFGMIGPLYAHIGRDPWSKRELVEPRPFLERWIARMFDPQSARGDFFADDELPETLDPALHSIFGEMVPMIEACATELEKTPVARSAKAQGKRFLGEVAYPMAGGTFRRPAVSYVVWMAQRMLEAYRRMPEGHRAAIGDWLNAVGGQRVLELALPRVRRTGLSAVRCPDNGGVS